MSPEVLKLVLGLIRLVPVGELSRLEQALRGGILAQRTTALEVSACTGISAGSAKAVSSLLAASELTPARLADALCVARHCCAEAQREAPSVDIVWTGPVQFSVPARATLWVMAEMLNSATSSITLVGYTLTEGASQVVQSLAAAVQRGVPARVIADRLDGQMLRWATIWPDGIEYPLLFSRPRSPGVPKSSLHAKLLVVDRSDALITSANLTHHGLRENIEIGVRVKGRVPSQLDDLFDELTRMKKVVPIQPPLT